MKRFRNDKLLFVCVEGILICVWICASNALDSEKNNVTFPVEFVNNNANLGEVKEFPSFEQLPCADLRGYAFHNATNKCWPIGKKGPCPDFMRFLNLPEHDGYGDCDCIPMKNCIGRPRTYWPETNRCYFIYSQGPCPNGSWLVFNKDKKPECRPNQCGQQVRYRKRSFDFVFNYNNTCYKTGTQGFCDQGQSVYIRSSDLKPKCYETKPMCRFLIFTANTLSCRPGSKRDVTGQCDHMREMHDDDSAEYLEY